MRPSVTYSDPASPSRQEGHSQGIFQYHTGVIASLCSTRVWWRRTRRLSVSDALCRLGAWLGNWNDQRHGEHLVKSGQVVRSLRWHAIGRAAGWLYVAPERRAA